MKQIRISGKHLGELAMPDFCPRCFWIKLHVKQLPFQIFAGIFSSIDSYSKKITNIYFEKNKSLLSWLDDAGLSGKPIKSLHHSKFRVIDKDEDILLTGATDGMIELSDESYAIVDYKTAKFAENQIARRWRN
jgi:ATP-dependent exoDNAse (exonuclease V) beta subunit